MRGPILAPSLRKYEASWLGKDLSAGAAIAAVGLPSAIAYPAVAGLPPQTGLYASIAPLIAYAFVGPSRQLIVGPDAATMTVLAAAITSVVAVAPGADRVALAGVLALGVGGLCLGARALRLGMLASFLSRPILIGFFCGVSLSILTGQLGRLTGTSIASDGLLAPFLELAAEAGSIHWPSLLLAICMFALLLVCDVVRLPVPGPVVVVAVAMSLSAVFDLRSRGIAVVGEVPAGLPALSMPSLADLPFSQLLFGATAIFLVSFGSGIVTARSFGARGGYVVHPNQELVGFGAANVAAGLTGGFPVSASDSRTAVNAIVGGHTQLAGIVAALVLVAILLFFSKPLSILPIPALGAILAAAAIKLIDVGALREIWRISRTEFVFAMVALAGPVGLGVLNGVVIAIAATLLYVIQRMMFPRDAELGRIAGRDGFYKLHRSPDARPVPGLELRLVQGSVLFFNTDYLEARMRRIIEEMPADTKWFVLDASAIVQVDATGAEFFKTMHADLATRQVAMGLTELHADVLALLERAGVIELLGRDMLFEDLDDALRAFEARYPTVNPTPGPERSDVIIGGKQDG